MYVLNIGVRVWVCIDFFTNSFMAKVWPEGLTLNEYSYKFLSSNHPHMMLQSGKFSSSSF